ncbi:MAG: hypothetical protein AAFU85_08490 [Planctomycetota bacterium]
MWDDIWHEPVMPTAEEQQWIVAAKRRIRQQRSAGQNDVTSDHSFSFRGLAVALCVISAVLGLVGLTVFLLMLT